MAIPRCRGVIASTVFAPRLPFLPPKLMRIFVVDFDQTITAIDTIAALASTAYRRPNNLPPFSHFSNVYMKHYRQYLLSAPRPTSFEQEVSYQQGLKSVELASVAEIERLGLFSGVTRDSIRAVARTIEVRPGFNQFLSRCQTTATPVVVLSVNWTSELIRPLVPYGDIICNELEFDGEECRGTFAREIRGIRGGIRTGADKLAVIQQLRQQQHHVTYVGDSRTDLLALCESDVGIVIEGGGILGELPWEMAVEPLGLYGEAVVRDEEKVVRDRAEDRGIYCGTWSEISEYVDVQ